MSFDDTFPAAKVKKKWEIEQNEHILAKYTILFDFPIPLDKEVSFYVYSNTNEKNNTSMIDNKHYTPQCM